MEKNNLKKGGQYLTITLLVYFPNVTKFTFSYTVFLISILKWEEVGATPNLLRKHMHSIWKFPLVFDNNSSPILSFGWPDNISLPQSISSPLRAPQLCCSGSSADLLLLAVYVKHSYKFDTIEFQFWIFVKFLKILFYMYASLSFLISLF